MGDKREVSMAEQAKDLVSNEFNVERIYEQPADSISFYSEIAQIVATENEVMLQFYESIPGAPGPGGKITTVKARLGATITVSPKHAKVIGQLLVEKTGGAK